MLKLRQLILVWNAWLADIENIEILKIWFCTFKVNNDIYLFTTNQISEIELHL